ncbi:uncharacterized protein LOC124416214 [Diprion similis]|uniref:uncharacterized protein LOC124416214 n=1 Tax=Diprion similis TaxID=362088 RepID=UPI001EF7E471|nr:uncharacterized protein LOC124416214 [Diprion similis]
MSFAYEFTTDWQFRSYPNDAGSHRCAQQTITVLEFSEQICITPRKDDEWTDTEGLRWFNNYFRRMDSPVTWIRSPTGGHQGVARTLKRIKLEHEWPHMRKDIGRHKKFDDTIAALAKEAPYEIAEFKHNPGIYFEMIATLQIYKVKWSLVVNMDLDSIFQRHRSRSHLGKMSRICSRQENTESTLCESLDEDIGGMLNKVEKNLDVLNDVGCRIDEEIEALCNDQTNLKSAMQKQIQIISSTLEIFNGSMNNIESNEKALREATRQLETSLSNAIDRTSARLDADEHIEEVGLIVEALLDDVKDLVDFLIDISKGTINPKVLPPTKILEYLASALPHLPQGYSFPIPLTRSGIPALMTIADIQSYGHDNNVVTVIEIPLVGNEEYNVNKIHPLPVRAWNNTYHYLETTEELAVVDHGYRNYVRMRQSDLESCKHLGVYYLCDLRHPTNVIPDQFPCEISIFAKTDIQLGECPKRAVQLGRTVLITLDASNSWAFVAPKPETIAITCNENPVRHETLVGSGTITFNGKRKNSACTQPAFNLSLHEDDLKAIPLANNISGKIVLKGVLRGAEVNSLGSSLNDLRNKLYSDQANYAAHWSHASITYLISSFIVIVFLGYIAYKYIIRRRSTAVKD